MKKFDKNKIISMLISMSGCLMACAVVVANFSQTSTCWCVFHQPKVPEALLERDAE